MAIEDIIWAKNRHMFGGIAPSNMIQFTASVSSVDNSKVTITAQPPEKTVVDGQTVCTVGGFVIRKKADGYPVNEFDGELVVKKTESGISTITDTITPGMPMYYAAFPFSKQDVYNRSAKNRVAVNTSIIHNATYFYGYDLDTADSNPDTRVSYPSDVDNVNYTAAESNDLKTWDIEPGTKFMPRPCMLNLDGTVLEYLDPNDYTKTVGGYDSQVSNTAGGASAMMEWSKIYTKRWEENGVYHFRCSDIKIDDDYECWCNYDSDDNEVDHFYTGIYCSGEYAINGFNSALSLMSGVQNTDSYNRARTIVGNTGAGWMIEHISEHLLILDLLTMLGGSTNLSKFQNVISKNGMFSGTNKIFGMDGYFNRLRWVEGISSSLVYDSVNRAGGSWSIKPKPTNTSNSIKFTEIMNDGYIGTMSVQPWGRLPDDATWSSSTKYECSKTQMGRETNDTCVLGGGVEYAFGYKFVPANYGAYYRLSYRRALTT